MLRARSFARRRLKSHRGQTMVEFALMTPFLLLFLFGIVDFGRALFIANELTNAAREGARVAVLSSNTCNTVVSSPSDPNCNSDFTGVTVCQAIRNEGQLVSTFSGCALTGPPDTSGTLPNPATTGTLDTAYVQITQSTDSTCPSTGSGGTVTTPRAIGNRAVLVQIWYYYRTLTPIVSRFFPPGFHLASSVCARPEY
jgi:Flp pilus assembly protein TadG